MAEGTAVPTRRPNAEERWLGVLELEIEVVTELDPSDLWGEAALLVERYLRHRSPETTEWGVSGGAREIAP